MLDVQAIKPQNLKTLSAGELATIAAQMLALISEQSRHISEQSKHIGEQSKRIDSQAQAIKWRDAKIESVTFQLARLKAWKFGAKTESMNAEQRDIFEETLAADQASLEAQLAALQGSTEGASAPQKKPRRQPKREALPAHPSTSSGQAWRAWTSALSPRTPIARRPSAASRWCAWART